MRAFDPASYTCKHVTFRNAFAFKFVISTPWLPALETLRMLSVSQVIADLQRRTVLHPAAITTVICIFAISRKIQKI